MNTDIGLLGPVARGNHLVAQNDEPEPTEPTEDELNAARAFALQMVDLDVLRRAGL